MLEETKKELQQVIWSTLDLYKSLAYGIVIGLVIGIVVGYSLGLPDFSNYQPTYLKG